MKITPGGVFLIKALIIDREEVVKAILIHRQNHKCLWLVVEFNRPETNHNFGYTYTMTDGRRIGAKSFSPDNLILDDDSAIVSRIGRIPDDDSVQICRDILSSGEAWKLRKLMKEQTKGISFWINFNPYVGVRIPGMRRS